MGIGNADQISTVMDITLIHNPDVMRMRGSRNGCLVDAKRRPKAVAGLGSQYIHARLNEQVGGTTAHSTSVSLDAGDD